MRVTVAAMFVACLVVLLLGLGVCDLSPSPVMATAAQMCCDECNGLVGCVCA